MILGFKKQFPWKEPTYFREKILAAVNKSWVYFSTPNDKGGFDQSPGFAFGITPIFYKPKIHTIREDRHNRWKAGRSIQMVYRGKNYSIEDPFNKGIPELQKCVSVQTISIKWLNIHSKPLAMMTGGTVSEMDSFTSTRHVDIKVDGHNINHERLQILARNDGFNSAEDFLNWFSEDFTGKVIHFTNFKYE